MNKIQKVAVVAVVAVAAALGFSAPVWAAPAPPSPNAELVAATEDAFGTLTTFITDNLLILVISLTVVVIGIGMLIRWLRRTARG